MTHPGQSGFAVEERDRAAVSRPGDAAEREADRIADRVAPPPSGVRADPGSGHVDARSVRDGLESPSRPLEAHERLALGVPGLDPSGVRVHAGGRAGDSALALGANAYAVGDHIVLGSGYDGRSAAG